MSACTAIAAERVRMGTLEHAYSGNKDTPRFRADLEQAFGVAGHPKAELLFRLAYEEGHGRGFHEVFLIYQDLVELIR